MIRAASTKSTVEEHQTDYLVVGGGASAMAFVDELLHTTDLTMLIVDRRMAPGGHWNDAYPFVRLHQPSAFYGVNSTPLGKMRKDRSGPNEGFYELASGSEIVNYYHSLMRERFLPSGRVSYFPLCDYVGDGTFVELLSGTEHRVTVKKRIVNATHLTTSIPMTHDRSFTVAPEVECIPPNHLPRQAPGFERVTVLGGGKTGIDSVIWLLSHGLPPEALSWVVPRDSWFFSRADVQPGPEFFEQRIRGWLSFLRSCIEAEDVDQVYSALERSGHRLRVDPRVQPGMFHAAIISQRELELLRRVKDIVRLGRVRKIEARAIELEQGRKKTNGKTLYVDCTASAAAENVEFRTPVFTPDTIELQMIRPFQPCFSAALIAHIERTIEDDAVKASMCSPTPMTDKPSQWIQVQVDGMTNSRQWASSQSISAWMKKCRLDASSEVHGRFTVDDNGLSKLLSEASEIEEEALRGLRRIAATTADSMN